MDDWIKSINEVVAPVDELAGVDTAPSIQLHVKGMMCERCSHHVKRAIMKSAVRVPASLSCFVALN